MTTHFEHKGKYRTLTKGNIDFWYGGGNVAYTNLNDAFNNIKGEIRRGKTIGVLELISGETDKYFVKEYCWPNDKIEDVDIYVKNPLDYNLIQNLSGGIITYNINTNEFETTTGESIVDINLVYDKTSTDEIILNQQSLIFETNNSLLKIDLQDLITNSDIKSGELTPDGKIKLIKHDNTTIEFDGNYLTNVNLNNNLLISEKLNYFQDQPYNLGYNNDDPQVQNKFINNYHVLKNTKVENNLVTNINDITEEISLFYINRTIDFITDVNGLLHKPVGINLFHSLELIPGDYTISFDVKNESLGINNVISLMDESYSLSVNDNYQTFNTTIQHTGGNFQVDLILKVQEINGNLEDGVSIKNIKLESGNISTNNKFINYGYLTNIENAINLVNNKNITNQSNLAIREFASCNIINNIKTQQINFIVVDLKYYVNELYDLGKINGSVLNLILSGNTSSINIKIPITNKNITSTETTYNYFYDYKSNKVIIKFDLSIIDTLNISDDNFNNFDLKLQLTDDGTLINFIEELNFPVHFNAYHINENSIPTINNNPYINEFINIYDLVNNTKLIESLNITKSELELFINTEINLLNEKIDNLDIIKQNKHEVINLIPDGNFDDIFGNISTQSIIKSPRYINIIEFNNGGNYKYHYNEDVWLLETDTSLTSESSKIYNITSGNFTTYLEDQGYDAKSTVLPINIKLNNSWLTNNGYFNGNKIKLYSTTSTPGTLTTNNINNFQINKDYNITLRIFINNNNFNENDDTCKLNLVLNDINNVELYSESLTFNEKEFNTLPTGFYTLNTTVNLDTVVDNLELSLNGKSCTIIIHNFSIFLLNTTEDINNVSIKNTWKPTLDNNEISIENQIIDVDNTNNTGLFLGEINLDSSLKFNRKYTLFATINKSSTLDNNNLLFYSKNKNLLLGEIIQNNIINETIKFEFEISENENSLYTSTNNNIGNSIEIYILNDTNYKFTISDILVFEDLFDSKLINYDLIVNKKIKVETSNVITEISETLGNNYWTLNNNVRHLTREDVKVKLDNINTFNNAIELNIAEFDLTGDQIFMLNELSINVSGQPFPNIADSNTDAYFFVPFSETTFTDINHFTSIYANSPVLYTTNGELTEEVICNFINNFANVFNVYYNLTLDINKFGYKVINTGTKLNFVIYVDDTLSNLNINQFDGWTGNTYEFQSGTFIAGNTYTYLEQTNIEVKQCSGIIVVDAIRETKILFNNTEIITYYDSITKSILLNPIEIPILDLVKTPNIDTNLNILNSAGSKEFSTKNLQFDENFLFNSSENEIKLNLGNFNTTVSKSDTYRNNLHTVASLGSQTVGLLLGKMFNYPDFDNLRAKIYNFKLVYVKRPRNAPVNVGAEIPIEITFEFLIKPIDPNIKINGHSDGIPLFKVVITEETDIFSFQDYLNSKNITMLLSPRLGGSNFWNRMTYMYNTYDFNDRIISSEPKFAVGQSNTYTGSLTQGDLFINEIDYQILIKSDMKFADSSNTNGNNANYTTQTGLYLTKIEKL